MTVSYSRSGGVAIVAIDRPSRRNAIDRATAEALGEAFDRFEADDAAVAVLTGTGGTFCAGADLVAFDLVETEHGWLGVCRRELSKPVVAAVEGHAVAGGLELALWADLRVAASDAVFGCFERRFGVPLVDGGTQRLPRIVGLGRALDMILTGRAVAAEEAERIGLVQRLSEPGRALEEAIALAETIASFPSATTLSDRRAVLGGIGLPFADGLEVEAAEGREVMDEAERGADRFADGMGRSGEGVPGP